jgi:hypothetical protein
MYDSSVVLPAPKKPDKSVTGSRESFSGTGISFEVVEFSSYRSQLFLGFASSVQVVVNVESQRLPRPVISTPSRAGGRVSGQAGHRTALEAKSRLRRGLDGDETPQRSLAHPTSSTSMQMD